MKNGVSEEAFGAMCQLAAKVSFHLASLTSGNKLGQGERSIVKRRVRWLLFSGPFGVGLFAAPLFVTAVKGLITQGQDKAAPAFQCPCSFSGPSRGPLALLCTLWPSWIVLGVEGSSLPSKWQDAEL